MRAELALQRAERLVAHVLQARHTLPRLPQLRLLLRSSTFVYCTLALSALFFVVTGIQFWSTEYLIRCIKAPYSTVLAAFAATFGAVRWR